MSIIKTLKKSVSLIVFVVVVIGVFWLMQKKVTNNIMYCTLISIFVAIALTYFQSKFIADALEQSESVIPKTISSKWWLPRLLPQAKTNKRVSVN